MSTDTVYLFELEFTEDSPGIVLDFSEEIPEVFLSMEEVPTDTVREHDLLVNRDEENSHPISAITGLEGRLSTIENNTVRENSPIPVGNITVAGPQQSIADSGLCCDDIVTKSYLEGRIPEIRDKSYIHNQLSVSSTWTITHNLGKMPSVTVVDSGRNTVVGEVTYLDLNSLIIKFTGAFSGKAYLN